MASVNPPEKEIKFNRGDTLEDLATRVKEGYDGGHRPILIACQDFTFPDNVVSGGIWESPIGNFQWAQIIFKAFQEVGGLPKEGTLRATPNPRYNFGQPYSMCLEYSPEH